MSPEQCRAARAWLDWSQARLAETAGVGLSTVKSYEAGKPTIQATQRAMQVALEAQGIAFSDEGETLGITGKRQAQQNA